MYKATSTFTQARNIAMALTMTFAATTLVTACGGDDSSDATQSPEAEMSSENQNSMSENNTQNTSDTEDNMDSEPVAEPDETETTAEADDTEASASDDASTTESEETDTSASDDTASAESDEDASAEAETHTVNAQGLKFAPLVVTIKPGDSVAWRNMNTHNSESIDGLIPEGAEKWNSPINQSYERTFTVEGIYVYKCTPHFGTGMGGAIIVGDPVNLEEIKNADAPGAAGRLVREAVSEAESM